MTQIDKTTRIHFIGIGGIGMSGIAEILLELGYKVSGSDLGESAVTERLKSKGAVIYKGHEAQNVINTDVVVYSSAIKKENPEYSHALSLNLPLMKRAEMLAQLMRFKKGIAIAGSHGKTTTTSLVASIFDQTDKDATHIIGGIVANLGGGNARSGKGDYLIAEADESDGSFLFLNPELIAVTNIDNDHLDHYGSKDKIEEAFVQFINQVPFFGKVIVNFDDATTVSLRKHLNRTLVWYSLCSDEAQYNARNIELSANGTEFDLYFYTEFQKRMHTPLWGMHNVSNAMAAIALCHQVGINLNDIQKGLSSFQGADRRLQKIYQDDHLLIIDDYAHHPTEINATLSSIKKVDERKLIGIFEPHRYSRMNNFWKEFQESLSVLDEVYVLPIYAASEAPIDKITSERFIQELNERDVQAHLIQKDEINDLFIKNKNLKNIIVTLGAGAISKIARDAVKSL